NLLIIVLSMHDERIYALRALRAGARGYVMKRESSHRIIEAVHEVLAGKLGVSAEISGFLSERFLNGQVSFEESPIQELSDRELQIFRLLGQGRDTRSIAESMHLSVKTVQSYCARIKEKLGITNGGELLREAIYWSEG